MIRIGNVLFNNALNTIYLRLYDVSIKDRSPYHVQFPCVSIELLLKYVVSVLLNK